MNSKTKFTLMVTAMVAVTLFAIVGIMAVFAATQQTFNTSITVVYKSTNVEGTATAQWKRGSCYYNPDGSEFWSFYDSWNDMDSNGKDAGGQTELDLSADGSLSLSPSQSIELQDEYQGVAFKYTFTNTATHPFTLNFKYQPISETNNINSFYATSSQEISGGLIGYINNKFTSPLETIVPGGVTENIYIFLRVVDIGSNSSFEGTFNIELQGQTTDYTEDFVYLYDGTNAMITGLVDPAATTLDIRKGLSFNDVPVTMIGNFAFQYNTNLKTVTLNGIEEVGLWAFRGCSSITSLTIGEDLKFADKGAFVELANLTNLNYYAADATMDDYGKNGVFSGAGLKNQGMEIVIGNDVINIPDYFCGLPGGPSGSYTNISNLTLGTSVQTIGDYAFCLSGLTSVGELVLPESVTSIGQGAFGLCSGVTSVRIPKNVTNISGRAFYKYAYQGNTNIVIDAANAKYTSRDSQGRECCVIIDKTTQTLIEGNGNSTIPDGVLHIGDSAFSGARFSGQLLIPESVISIGNSAFIVGSGLSEITIDSRTVCENLKNWESNDNTWTGLLDNATTVKAKYEVVGLEDEGWTKQAEKEGEYFVYTKNS